MNKTVSLWLIVLLTACNLTGQNRFPAFDEVYLQTDEPVAFAQIKLSTIENTLKAIIEKNKMLQTLERFEMDPVTRILNIRLSVRYPLASLFNFTQVPTEDMPESNDLHTIEMAIGFPETKTLAQTRYLSLTFHKFLIDGDDYIDAFEIVAATAQTILANSELVDYLYAKNSDKIPEGDYRTILQEVLNDNSIVVFHTSKKINFKLDLNKIARLSPYAAEYANLRLWRFSPTLFDGKEVRFKIIAGEGKPTDRWLQSQENRILEDRRTLLQVRNDLYQEFGDIRNVQINNNSYLNQLLGHENIKIQKLPANYKREIQELMQSLSNQSQTVLNRKNENFIADPEYEYVQFTEYSQVTLRNFVSDLDRRLTIDRKIKAGGSNDPNKKPLVTKLVSQNLLNKGMNFLIDLEVDGNQLFTEAEFWLLPQLPGITLKGKLHLPIEYLLGLMDKKLIGENYQSKITDSQTGFPIELTLESKLADNGVLGLDIKTFTIKSGEKKIRFDRNAKNHQFLIDLTKIYLANTLSSLKFESEDIEDREEAKRKEAQEIMAYIQTLKTRYQQLRNSKLNELFIKDIQLNPYIDSGREHLERKTEILYGKLISYNEQNKMFEMELDPDIVVDKINNVRHNLQVWSLTPLKSKELNNTFLELAVGHGLRSQKYIDELYFRAGQAENSQFSGIYYELGNERSAVDLLFSLNFEYLEMFANNFLAEMVKHNQINVEKQAEEKPGETFFEIQHVDIEINSKKRIMLDLKIKSAKKARTWYTAFIGKKLKVDTYAIGAEIELSSKMVNIGPNNLLTNLKYFPNAISVNPKRVKIKSGSPSLVNRALTSLVSKGANLILNNGTFKKLLLKIVNKSFRKMYS